jgi:DNA-nicking Smr family endonuclease
MVTLCNIDGFGLALMKLLFEKFFKNLFRDIEEQKEKTSLKGKGYEKQDLRPLTDIKDGGRIKNLTKDTDDHNEITEDSSFFIDNFHEYKPEESKDEPYDEQIKNRRRKKEPVTVQAELDLHGKTSDEALMRLKSFIESSKRRGFMCVLIIVGKGIHSEGGRPVLRSIVETWLNGEGKAQISKYKNAPPKLGGSGAIEVWLK